MKTRKTIMPNRAPFRRGWLALLGFLCWSGLLYAQCSAWTFYDTVHLRRCFSDYTELTDHFLSPSRRDQTLRIIQPRGDMPTRMVRHHQYDDACSFFSTSAVVEYLGYSRFEPGAHFESSLLYLTRRDGYQRYNVDVGYKGSAEDLIVDSYTFETIFRTLWGGEGTEIYRPGILDGNALNVVPSPCAANFTAANQYGLCTNPGSSAYPAFFDSAANGCQSPERPCHSCADAGLFFFLNRTLAEFQQIGINDATYLRVDNAAKETIARRVIKAFIDHNTPMVFGVQRGRHFMVLIGYAGLDEHHLPTIGIAADPVLRVFWKIDLMDWESDQRWSPWSIVPWNQRLQGACAAGGWAREVDQHLKLVPYGNPYLMLCEPPAACPDDRAWIVNLPFYGFELQTSNRPRQWDSRFFAYADDPFVFTDESISCDAVILRFNDGRHRVKAAKAYRYQRERNSANWTLLSALPADFISHPDLPAGRGGPANSMLWQAAWQDNYWLTTADVPADHSQRRTVFELTFDDNRTRRLELCPPGTYGLTIRYVDKRMTKDLVTAEPRREVFLGAAGEERMVFPFADNKSGDQILMSVQLGQDLPVASAEIQRYFYTRANGEWRPANPAWPAQKTVYSNTNLSGPVLRFTWDEVWPENNWIVAKDIGADHSDRKTVIRLKDAGGQVLRVVELTPY